MMLLDAVRSIAGPDAIRAGKAFERFEPQERGVAAHFTDRNTGGSVVVEADVLVGADGIGSRLRAQLHPGEGAPNGNGVRM